MSKTCTKCGETKPLDGFHRNKRNADGRNSYCKECMREYGRRYYKENREKVLERNRRYHKENREKEREYDRRYYKENREKVLERNRRYHKENREKEREYDRRYYEENRDKKREYKRRYHEENRDIINWERKIRHAQKTRISNLLTSKKGVPYSPEEDALILCDNGMTDYQKAIELGRTHGSVKKRKYHLRARVNH